MMSSTKNPPQTKPAVARTVADVRWAVAEARKEGKIIAFVPTMGALHAGHVSLIEAARKPDTFVIVSIYVNPTQFNSASDLEHYPRTFEADRLECERSGVDLIFAPLDQEMYPPGDETRVSPGSLEKRMCGLNRPGHFEGVCTVVAKLFNIVSPDAAYFGQKDAQQVSIIRRMVTDLRMPVQIEVCPLVREKDGLALSSRNVRLTGAARQDALCLYRALCQGRDLLLAGSHSTDAVLAAMRDTIPQSETITIDYLVIVDPDTLASASRPRGRVMLAGAVNVGEVRLIDNILVDLPED